MVHWKNVETNKTNFKTPFFLLCTIILPGAENNNQSSDIMSNKIKNILEHVQ